MTGRDPIPSLEFRGRLIVHVGIHKTGTTSIQGALDAGYQQLRDNGILYPKAGRAQEDGNVEALHHPLIKSLIDEEDRTASSRIEALRSEIHDASSSTVILSSEVLSREYLSSQVFRDIQAIFPDASRTWIIYLRRQDQLAMSRYAEGIKVGLVAWPDGVRHTLQPVYLDHRLRRERLQHAVGHDMIVLVSFDAAKDRLMASLFEAAGLEMTGTLPSARHANASLPWGRCNCFGSPYTAGIRQAVRTQGRICIEPTHIPHPGVPDARLVETLVTTPRRGCLQEIRILESLGRRHVLERRSVSHGIRTRRLVRRFSLCLIRMPMLRFSPRGQDADFCSATVRPSDRFRYPFHLRGSQARHPVNC